MGDIAERITANDGRIMEGEGTLAALPGALARFAPEGAKVLLIADGGFAAAERVRRALSEKYRVSAVPPARTVKAVTAIKPDEDCKLVVSAGGGGAADAGKFVATAAGVPHAAVMLSQASGGILTETAVLTGSGGADETYRVRPPEMIALDYSLLPDGDGNAAGFGEVCSRLTSLFDMRVCGLLGGPTVEREIERETAALVASLISAAAEGRADKAEIARHVLALSVLAGKDRSLYGGGDERAAAAVRIYKRARGEKLRLHGESALTFALATIRTYIAFLCYLPEPIRVPDNNLRIGAMRRMLGLDLFCAADGVETVMPAAELEEKMYVLGVYRRALIGRAAAYEKAMNFALGRQKTLYKDAGFGYNKYVAPSALGYGLSLAPEMHGRPTLLSLVKQTGALDRLLMR